MNFLYWIVIGFIAGLLAKAIMPGSAGEPSGWILTILLGIVGAVVGGWLGGLLGVGGGGLLWSIVLATIGAIVLIALMRLFTGRRTPVG